MAVYGALFGMALGLALGGAAAVVLFEEMGVEVTVPVARFAIVGLVAAVAVLVAAVLPARRAARMNVLEAVGSV